MKNFLLLLSVFVLLTSCGSDPAPDSGSDTDATTTPAAPDETFLIRPGTGMGVFSDQMNGEQLKKLLGSNRCQASDFYVGEGESLPGLTLYPGTREEVEVLLDEDGMPIMYRLQKADSKWATADGLKVGSTLQELEKINGKPFKFMGFDWDYGGTVTNWEDGTLADKDFMLVLTYAGEPTFAEADLAKIMGEQEVMSNDPVLAKYSIIVEQIIQRY
ncbi:MAG: hypothetical protein C7N36_19895 [Bacteroidetes bacterium]|nr:MAG: hypothetical protein C7N36_19895 [Bacteroidota bacterium]